MLKQFIDDVFQSVSPEEINQEELISILKEKSESWLDPIRCSIISFNYIIFSKLITASCLSTHQIQERHQ